MPDHVVSVRPPGTDRFQKKTWTRRARRPHDGTRRVWSRAQWGAGSVV